MTTAQQLKMSERFFSKVFIGNRCQSATLPMTVSVRVIQQQEGGSINKKN
jgi:hypothetical protein